MDGFWVVALRRYTHQYKKYYFFNVVTFKEEKKMSKTGIFTGVSVAVMAGAIAYFSEISASRAADIDATKVYMTHCKTCHGENGHPTDLGTGLGAREFANAEWQAKTTDEQIIKQINNGTPEKMMPFKEKLSQDEIKALVSVIRGFGKK
ncbi:MAG: hypothetical protein B6D35_05650 [Candidatus Brocadia sp. UTAMX2]|jgi:mono/diheme cytochrome c family protein|nr:MAG: hypothetical protein B6D35_05650 [Candidatus Brocadia sp. UTAMX2]